MRGRHPRRSPSVESFTDRFKSWNSSLSTFQLRGSIRPKTGLHSVHEGYESPFSSAVSFKSTQLSPYAKDSAVDLGEVQEICPGVDKIFKQHDQSGRLHTPRNDRSRSITRGPVRTFDRCEADEDEQFLERIQRLLSPRKSDSAASTPAERRPSLRRAYTSTSPIPRAHPRSEKALPPLPGHFEGEASTQRRNLMHTIKSNRHLHNMKSLSTIKTYVNPHESMDFRCVGSPVEAFNAFEEDHLQIEKEELLRSINFTRTKMCRQAIHNLEASSHLDREAQDVANDLDRFESVPAGSTITTDEETLTAQLIGPAGFPGFATGERWASFQNKAPTTKQCACKGGTNIVRSGTCPCRNYNVFTAITDESWKTIGMARTAVDRRWVVLLSASLSENDDAKSMRSILTPASSIRHARGKSKSRRAEEPPPLPVLCASRRVSLVESEDGIPALPTKAF